MKGVIIFLFVLLSSFFAGELILRVLGFESLHYESFKLKSDKRDYLIPDSINGFGIRKGVFNVDLNGLKYKATHNSSGNRVTFSVQNKGIKVGMFGCSFTYGMGVNDSNTSSSNLQSLNPNLSITNYGVPGFGNVQTYYQIEKIIKSNTELDVAIINFCDFHLERNVMSPVFRKHLNLGFEQNLYKNQFSTSYLPFVTIEHDTLLFQHENWNSLYSSLVGVNSFAFINAIQGSIDNIKSSSLDQNVASLKLFQRINLLCNTHSIKLIVVGLTKGKITSDFVDLLSSNQINAFYSPIPFKENKYNNFPLDSHPNSKAHEFWANMLNNLLFELELLIQKQ